MQAFGFRLSFFHLFQIMSSFAATAPSFAIIIKKVAFINPPLPFANKHMWTAQAQLAGCENRISTQSNNRCTQRSLDSTLDT